jgi:hypothetical protein
MIRRAIRLRYESDADADLPPWEEYLAACRKSPRLWTQNLPGGHEDYSELGPDADLMLRVAEVVDAVLRPPD